MTYAEMVELAMEFPDVQEKPSYGGRPRVKRAGRDMFGLAKDEDTISIGVGWELHDWFLAENPGVIYKTPHYEGWASFLVKLDELDLPLAKELVEASWNAAQPKTKGRKKRDSSSD